MKINIVFIALIVAICCSMELAKPSLAKEKRQEKNNEKEKPKVKLDYEKLVADLVNHNPEPKILKQDGERHASFANGYDWNEMKRIDQSLQSLIDNFDDAWPTLVKHIDDKGYCLTANVDFDSTEFQENFSVGKVCRTLLKENLTKPCHSLGDQFSWVRMHNPDFIRDSKKEPDKFKKWFNEQIIKNCPFYEMQIDAAEWALKEIPKNQADRLKAEMEEIERVAKENKDIDVKKSKEVMESLYSVEKPEIKAAMKGIQEDLDQLKKTKKPLLMTEFNWGDGMRDMIKRDPRVEKVKK